MIYRRLNIRKQLTSFVKGEEGSSIVELAFVIPLFLLLLFGLMDFGRMAYHHVASEKAVQLAARLAAVRPPVCTGLPTINSRGTYSDATGPRFGTNCDFAGGVCAEPAATTCTAVAPAGTDAEATADEIWNRIQRAFPTDPTANFDRSNLVFTYTFDPEMNFLGGPYVPMVTVTVEDLPFRYVSPLGALAALAGGGATAETDALTTTTSSFKIFTDFSATLPGEDLANGSRG